MKKNQLSLNIRRSNSRRSGATLTELLVASLLMGLTMAVLGEVMGLMTLLAGRVNNKASVIDSERVVMSRIASDVRAARTFGDAFALVPSERYQFPSSSNPIYGSSGISVSNSPYRLSSHTLILQQPSFYTAPNGDFADEKFNIFPIAFKSGDSTSAPISATLTSGKIENLETVIYDVVPTAVTGNWEIVMKRFPGATISNFPNGIQPSRQNSYIDLVPQTVGKGLIGPLSRSGDSYPVVFQYYVKNSAGLVDTLDSAQLNVPGNVDRIIGIGINLEMKKPESADQISSRDQQVGLHSEVFCRSNKGIIRRF